MRRTAKPLCHEMADALIDIATQACVAGGRPDLVGLLQAMPPVSDATIEVLRSQARELRRQLSASRTPAVPGELRQLDATDRVISACVDIVANIIITWTAWTTKRLIRILDLELMDLAQCAVEVGVLEVRTTLLADGSGYAVAASVAWLLDPAGQAPKERRSASPGQRSGLEDEVTNERPPPWTGGQRGR